MDYLITGSTGLVGSHVLFELFKKLNEEKSKAKIYLLVRKGNAVSPRSRIENILFHEESPLFLKDLPIESLLEQIEFIDSDLNNPQLPDILSCIPSKSLTVVHIAASTNLMQGPNAEQDVYENNYMGTLNLLRGIKETKVKKFSFISTAFSCGVQDEVDLIDNDYLKYPVNSFRNPYEGHKNKVERILNDECRQMGIDLQILRPAVVCGRLIDVPHYVTTKFDVFYGWAKFFYARKEKIGENKFRIAINKEGTQNIIPADYVAKVIVKALHMDNVKQLNIVNNEPPLHSKYLSKILDEIGITNYEFVDSVPEDLSVWEMLYYKSVGRVFEPYLCYKNLVFDTSRLTEEFGEFQYDSVTDNFGELIQFAISKKFDDKYMTSEMNSNKVMKLSSEEEIHLRNQA